MLAGVGSTTDESAFALSPTMISDAAAADEQQPGRQQAAAEEEDGEDDEEELDPLPGMWMEGDSLGS